MTKVYEVTSWQEFLTLVESEELRGWAFRGQCDATWDLESSLTRRLKQFVPQARWAEQEGRAIRVFKRKAHYFLHDTSALNDDFRCLALMQHHARPHDSWILPSHLMSQATLHSTPARQRPQCMPLIPPPYGMKQNHQASLSKQETL